MVVPTTSSCCRALLLLLLLMFIVCLQSSSGKNVRIIQDDWSHHSNGLFEPVYTRLHRVPSTFSSSRMERSLHVVQEPESRVLVVRAQNRTLYVELEPSWGLTGPDLDRTNLSHAPGYFEDRPCLYRGKLLNGGGGRAAINLCQGPDKMSGLLVTPEGPLTLRPLEDEEENKVLRRRKRSPKDGATMHMLRPLTSPDKSFCGIQHQHDSDWEPAWPGDPTGRIRRAVTRTGRMKTIETAVFADSDLYELFKKKHGESEALEKLTNMVLAIMNEVQLIYTYDTMKTQIKIVIVTLEILKPGDNAPDKKGGDIDQYLDTFCAWQSKKVPANGQPGHWDHAILLTGLNLFKEYDGKNNDKVLGLAWVNGMCRPTYSCTINEGKDFEAAYVIAHELAHSLGVLHDGTGNACDPDKFIMSDKTGPGKISWSDCSNQYMERYFNRGHARCLDGDAEPPTPRLSVGLEQRPPGERYGPEEQCHLAMGPRYKPYSNAQEPFNNICRELWCYTGTWATPAHPALDGSQCQRGRRCRQGLCQVERQTDGDLDVGATDGNNDTNSTIGEEGDVKSDADPGANKPRAGFFNTVSTFFREVLKKVQGFFKTTG